MSNPIQGRPASSFIQAHPFIKALVILVLAAPSLFGQFRQEASIYITNLPVSTDTLTMNGDTRTWAPTNSTVKIMATNTIAKSLTNMFTHVAAYPLAGQVTVRWGTSGSNIVVSGGTNVVLAVTFSPGWGLVSYSTSLVYSASALRMPYTVESNLFRTNQMSMLITSIVAYATNPIPTGAVVMANYPDSTTVQTMSNKTFMASVFNGGTVTNVVSLDATNGRLAGIGLVGLTNAEGNVGSLTNGIAQGWKMSNAVIHATNGYISNFIAHTLVVTNLSSPGSGNASMAVGTLANAAGHYSVALGNAASALKESAIAIGTIAYADGLSDVALYGSTAGGNAIAIGASQATATNAIAIGNASVASHTNAVAFGNNAATTAGNQIMLGSNHRVDVPGLLEAAAVTNALLKGSNVVNGNVSILPGSVTTLVNAPSVNLADFPTNAVVLLSGPTAAWTLDSIQFGWGGRYHLCRNATAYQMTVMNESGGGAAVDRILTPSSGNTVVGIGEWFSVWYDSAVSRWRLISYMPSLGLTSLTVSNINSTNLFFSAPTNHTGMAATALTSNIPPCLSPVGLFGYLGQVSTNGLIFSGAVADYTNVFSTLAADKSLTNGFHCNLATGFLTNLYAGYYKVTFSASCWPDTDQNGDELEMEVFLNEVAQEYIRAYLTGATGVKNHWTGSGMVYLPAGTGISLRVRNESDASCTLHMLTASISVGTP